MEDAITETPKNRTVDHFWSGFLVSATLSLSVGMPLTLLRVCVSGALRLYYSITNEKSNDPTWDGFNLYIWESVEVNLGIVCASAPCLKALVARVLPRLMGSHSASNVSHTPAAHYQMNARRNVGGQPDYILDSMGQTRRENRLGRESGDSQEGLTKVLGRTFITRVDVDRIV